MNKETLSTSEKEIPKHRNALSEKYEQEDKKIGSEPRLLRRPSNVLNSHSSLILPRRHKFSASHKSGQVLFYFILYDIYHAILRKLLNASSAIDF